MPCRTVREGVAWRIPQCHTKQLVSLRAGSSGRKRMDDTREVNRVWGHCRDYLPQNHILGACRDWSAPPPGSLSKPLSSEPSPTGPFHPAVLLLPPGLVPHRPSAHSHLPTSRNCKHSACGGVTLPKSLQAPPSLQENIV